MLFNVWKEQKKRHKKILYVCMYVCNRNINLIRLTYVYAKTWWGPDHMRTGAPERAVRNEGGKLLSPTFQNLMLNEEGFI